MLFDTNKQCTAYITRSIDISHNIYRILEIQTWYKWLANCDLDVCLGFYMIILSIYLQMVMNLHGAVNVWVLNEQPLPDCAKYSIFTLAHTHSGKSTQLIRITSCMEHTWTWTRLLSHPAAAFCCCCCSLQLPHAASSAWAAASSSRTSANDLINHRVRQRNIPWFCLCRLCLRLCLCPGCRCCWRWPQPGRAAKMHNSMKIRKFL